MDEFCGSEFWNWKRAWYTNDPDLTLCFENSVLLTIPCALIWLLFILEIHKYYSVNPSEKRPWSCLNITKIIVVLFLITSEVVYSTYEIVNKNGSNIQPVYYYSPLVKISSLILSLCLHLAQRTVGIYSSGLQFMFWLLLSIYQGFFLRTIIKTVGNPTVIALASIPSFFVFFHFFLNFFSDSHSDGSNYFPDVKASFPSQLVFNWVGKLLREGYKKPLEFSNLWHLHPSDRADFLITEFDKHTRREPGNNAKRSVFKNLLNPLFYIFGGAYSWATLYCTSAMLLSFLLPPVLSLLISFIEDKNTVFIWRGYFYAALLAIVAFVKAILHNRNFYLKVRIGAFVKTVISSAVYRKALKISNAARKDKTVGEIVNLLSVDVVKLMNFIYWMNAFWDAPLQMFLAIFFLYVELGVALFSGVAVLLLYIPGIAVVSKKMQSFQTAQMDDKDQRVKLMGEIIAGMKILKLYAWEPSFEQKVKDIRNKEIAILKKKALLTSFDDFIWTFSPVLVAITTFSTYVLLGNHLDAKKAFVSLALFDLLNSPATMLPVMISRTVELCVSLKRLNDFMNAEEIDPNDVEHNVEESDAVIFENADFCWESGKVTLENLNVKVSRGSLVAVVGMVGNGKSSLISAILGEMKKLQGRVNVSGKVAYVSQQPWIQNDSLRNNIYFGNPADNQRYNKVLQCCELLSDLEILPGGDQTEIGEKGINLSGGQKQRVALARAAYSNSDVYLLDDPLSAVDSHVGKNIFEHLLGPSGLLKSKTRIFVTHSLTYLPQVDQIIVMTEGKISECGTYQELLNKKGAFSEFLISYVHENSVGEGKSGSSLKDIEKIGSSDRIRRLKNCSTSDVHIEETANVVENKIIEEENTEVGGIKSSVIITYMKMMNWSVAFGLIILYMAYQALSVGSNVVLSVWTSVNSSKSEEGATRDKYLMIYTVFGFSECLMYLFVTVILNLSTLAAAKKLHNRMLSRILRAPMSLFETTPLGRIVNRFSSDIQNVDAELPSNLEETLDSFFKVIAILVIISWSTPGFLFLVFVIAFLFICIQRYYIRTARQIFRIDSITKSPVFSHLTETLHGVSTIRAYCAQERFIEESSIKIDNSVNTMVHSLICRRWLALRLEALGCLVIFFSALFSVLQRKTLNSSIVGLSVSYALKISQSLTWLVLMSAYLETNLVSVERICEYIKTVQEAEWKNENQSPAKEWPDKGVIEFDNYETKYRKNLDPVVKNITCRIEAGEKIGIVGRTGAGKSSMTLALFRIIEPTGGRIIIDGENIVDLGLHDIRGRLTIIPQDPVLFSGSLRFNLDPFSNYEDENLWKSLELAHLKVFVRSLDKGLDYEVTEGGENLSVGQRQLVCLARAILRKSKILILDEATASIDLETDELIQETIRKEFKECTVLTIAHRINTIMDSSRVMVLEKGEILEFDQPQNLLANKSSLFYQFTKDAGLLNK